MDRIDYFTALRGERRLTGAFDFALLRALDGALGSASAAREGAAFSASMLRRKASIMLITLCGRGSGRAKRSARVEKER